jgi:protein-disulfide isomerase
VSRINDLKKSGPRDARHIRDKDNKGFSMNSHMIKRLLGGAAITLSLGFAMGAPAQAEELSDAQKAEIEGVIEQYLLENPDVLLRAIQNVQVWQTTEQARQQAEAIEPVWDALVADSSVPSVGPLDAPVTVIEFFDYHCGYCKRAFDGVKELAENSDGKVRTMFVEFPILREESADAARAALAAAKQGKYMEIHAAFMENRGILDEAQINTLAKDAGVDVDQMRKDMQSPEINGMLQQYAAMARSIGVNGTPAFLINGQMVSGADMERVNALVKAGLEQAS